MSEDRTEQNLDDEFRSLGQNLAELLRSAWESPERKRVQQEIEEGVIELAAALKKEVATFHESPTGQQLKSEVDELRQRVRSGEAGARIREELLNALRLVNAELRKAASRQETDEPTSTEAGAQPEPPAQSKPEA